MKSNVEYILCAAIWVDDGVNHVNMPTDTGLVFGGRRHNNCIPLVNAVYGSASDCIAAGKPVWTRVQGFITSSGRFVNRTEGAEIAKAAEQGFGGIGTELMSDDLY